MCSARRLMTFNICVKFHENMSSGFKVGKSELRFMCSARRLMVFDVCVKLHESRSTSFKLLEWT